jgi:predicted transcriptional regulator
MEARKLLFELSHPVRYDILHVISKKPTRLTKIAELVDANKPEVSRHLDRLKEVGVIEKDVEGAFRIAPMGHLIMNCLPNIEFIAQRSEFFQNHDLSLLPPQFISRLGDLKESELKEGAFGNIEFTKGILEGTEKRIRVVTREALGTAPKGLLWDLKRGVDYKLVVSEDFEFPIAIHKCREGGYPEEILDLMIDITRFIPSIPVASVVNEKEAVVAFPARDGNMDYSVGFYSTDEYFMRWCWDLIEFLWEQGTRWKGTLD